MPRIDLGRITGFHVLFATGIAFLVVRSILNSDFRNSTLLYLAVPFALSILLHRFTTRSTGTSAGARYANHLRDATIVFLATSALLFEGFLCVLMFMPIYYVGATLGFAFMALRERAASDRARLGTYGIPALVVLLSAEGLADPLTVPRDREARQSMVIDQPVAALQANMAKPIAFEARRHWFLSVFPLPERVEAGSLSAGDVHTLAFTYRRWFLANIHQGEMRLRILEVGPALVRTEIVSDTSYLSHYLRIDGTEVRFTDLGSGRTEVALAVRYRRLLDPAWYFGPLQHFVVEKSARYLIETVIERRSR